MIKIENVEVSGWKAAIRGMRNPMNSWGLSDSVLCPGEDGFRDCRTTVLGDCPRKDEDFTEDVFCVGENDMRLMKNLVSSGTDHSKFMRFIIVTVDVTAPLYWWKEFDTYKVGTVSNSCSTMHKIQEKEFVLDDFSHEHLKGDWEYDLEEDCHEDLMYDFKNLLTGGIIPSLNFARRRYLETNNKDFWWQMIQLLPSSYNQRRTVLLNYQVLRNMYHGRKHHKLDEWREFCRWIETLPYAELITEL